MPDLRLGHELERRLDHADPRAKNRNETHFVPETRAFVRGERSLDLAVVGREIGRRLVQEERRDLGDELAEDLRRRRLVAQTRDLLLYERMRRYVKLFRGQLATRSGVIPGTG
jgi:hypothetical protein